MSTYTLNDWIQASFERFEVKLEAGANAVSVFVSGPGDVTDYSVPVILEWDRLDDVEYLADKFRAQRVDVFQLIVTMCGKAFKHKDTLRSME